MDTFKNIKIKSNGIVTDIFIDGKLIDLGNGEITFTCSGTEEPIVVFKFDLLDYKEKAVFSSTEATEKISNRYKSYVESTNNNTASTALRNIEIESNGDTCDVFVDGKPIIALEKIIFKYTVGTPPKITLRFDLFEHELPYPGVLTDGYGFSVIEANNYILNEHKFFCYGGQSNSSIRTKL